MKTKWISRANGTRFSVLIECKQESSALDNFEVHTFDKYLHNHHEPAIYYSTRGLLPDYYLNGVGKDKENWEIERQKYLHDEQFQDKMNLLIEGKEE